MQVGCDRRGNAVHADAASRVRRGCAPNPTPALAGTPEPHSGPAGRALSRAFALPVAWSGR